ncbi:hypothetical protein HGA91_06065 [candidate division WWE3 bacterium]|nr:hypothetical protein [candidate division WWE3 bacterium]
MRYFLFILIVGLLGYGWVSWFSTEPGPKSMPTTATSIRYVAIGDGYSIGEGLHDGSSWPELLTDYLRKRSVDIHLEKVLGNSNTTSTEVIESIVPKLSASNPEFITLQIGANDLIQNVSAESFREKMQLTLSSLTSIVPTNRIIVITIPDLSILPIRNESLDKQDSSTLVQTFNQIIIEESGRLSIASVDISKLALFMADSEYVTADGLYPSSAGHKLIAEAIYPTARRLLLLK